MNLEQIKECKCRSFYCREKDIRLIFYYLMYLDEPFICGTVSNVFRPETESDFMYYKNQIYINNDYFTSLNKIIKNIIKQLK